MDERKRCPKCNSARLGEKTIYDDWDGKLTCFKCGNRVDRWVKRGKMTGTEEKQISNLRLPLLGVYPLGRRGPGPWSDVMWALRYVVPNINHERLWLSKKYGCQAHLFYVEEDEEVKRIRAAYARYDELPAWNDVGYDKEEYHRLCKEFDNIMEYIQNNQIGQIMLGSNFGIGLDMADSDKEAGSYKSYLISRYMHLEEVMNGKYWEGHEDWKALNLKLCKLWIDKDNVMYKDWAKKMQGFDLDEFNTKYADWIESLRGRDD